MARTTIAKVGFLDRLGDRVVVADRSGGDLEVLRLRPELTGDPAFETCMKARGEQLSALQHRNLARVRGVSRLPSPDGRLAVVSEAAKGWRLSEVLQAAEQEGRLIHTTGVLFLLRQVASAVAALHALGPDVSHGGLGPERVVVAPGGHVFVVEYVLGSALPHLPSLPADRLWKELRLAVPADGDGERFGQSTDVLQLGIIALSLVHNRQLRRDEYPGRIAELLESATESRLIGDRQPLGTSLRNWLSRALQLAPEDRAWTMTEALQGLEWLVSKEGGYLPTPVGLEPLLQSVARFSTVAPADAGRAPGPATTAVLAARPGISTPPAAREPSMSAAPAPRARPEPVERQESSEQAPPAIAPAPAPAPAPTPVAVAPAPEVAAPATPVPAPRPAETALEKPAVLETPEETAQSKPSEPDADELVVKPSPLAEFAAERVTETSAVPVAPRPSPASQELPWPPPPPRPEPAQSRLPADVAPVADMLSFDRPAAPRRPGRRSQPWVSGPEERVGGPHRAASPADAPPVAKPPKSGGAPAAPAKTADAAGAQRAATTSATLRSGAVPVAVPTQSDVRPTHSSSDARPSWDAAERPPSGLPAKPATEPKAGTVGGRSSAVRAASDKSADNDVPAPASVTRPARASSTSSPVASRSLFGSQDDSHGVEEEETSSGGSMTKWIAAAAAVVVLALGGFTAWKYFKTPTIPPMPSDSAVAEKASPRAAEASAAPAPAARESAAQPAPAPPRQAAAAAAPSAETAAPVMGSIQLVSAVRVSVSENGQAIGSSEAAVSLPVGRHILEITNEELGVRVSRSVDVRPGRPVRVEVPLPRGSVNINATPWADVSIDGQRIGETPLANVPLTVGSHEVRFKHPQLGEQVRSVVVVAGSTGRLSVDMK